jgi:hypothetical protein
MCLRTADFPTDPDLHEAIRALHGTRLVRTFGTWRGASLTDTPVEGTWEIVGPLSEILRLAVDDDPDACAILRALNTPASNLFQHEHPPRPPPLPEGHGPPLRMQTSFDFQPSPLF